MIQGVISRIAGYSSEHKNYCITLVTAAGGLATALQKPWVVAITLLPIIAFSLLDSRFLVIERRYRALFDRVRSESLGEETAFEMGVGKTSTREILSALCSWSILTFYFPIIIGTGVVATILGGCFG
jgi:hypothetical protein